MNANSATKPRMMPINNLARNGPVGHTPSSDGKPRPSSPSPTIRAGIWRCAMPMAPRQLPPLPPPNWANPAARVNSRLDKTWGQGQVA
jgi:hypothetical protein